ncbi:hypothetical protein ACHAXT_007742 [Thalassiosira profunda]
MSSLLHFTDLVLVSDARRRIDEDLHPAASLSSSRKPVIPRAMAKGSMSDEEGRCRFAWRPKLLAVFITAALGLSVMSSLDCKFQSVDLAFVPQNYYSDEVGIGLISYTAPDGRCMSYGEAQAEGGFSDGDEYKDLFINKDTSWTISRVFALVGIIFGGIAFVSIAINVCRSEPHLVDILAYSTICAFLCECSKLGIFLGIDMCISDAYWFNEETNEYTGSVGCQVDRGAFMSIASLVCYFVSMTMAVGFAARPKKDDGAYDDASLPSWMESENGTGAKAQASPPNKDRRESVDRQSSAYDWSRSNPSTIPSQQTPTEDYALERAPSDQPAEREEEENDFDLDWKPEPIRPYRPTRVAGEWKPEPIRSYRPKRTAPKKKYDDMSALTWDPGY